MNIAIKDLNDNSPVFDEPSYKANITEEISGIPITLEKVIVVRDDDQDVIISYYLY